MQKNISNCWIFLDFFLKYVFYALSQKHSIATRLIRLINAAFLKYTRKCINFLKFALSEVFLHWVSPKKKIEQGIWKISNSVDQSTHLILLSDISSVLPSHLTAAIVV